MNLVTAIFASLAEFLGLRRRRLDAQARPEVRANRQAATDARERDRHEQAVADAMRGDAEDLERLRREASR